MTKDKTLVVNLFGGPGCGKSTMAASVFSALKHEQLVTVELVTEYAKDMVYQDRDSTLRDQLYMLAKQQHRLNSIIKNSKHRPDVIITDSPLLLNNIYADEDSPKTLKELCFELHDQHWSLNFLLSRDKPYVEKGRLQNEQAAKDIDEMISLMLDAADVPYTIVSGDPQASCAVIVNSIYHETLGVRKGHDGSTGDREPLTQRDLLMTAADTIRETAAKALEQAKADRAASVQKKNAERQEKERAFVEYIKRGEWVKDALKMASHGAGLFMIEDSPIGMSLPTKLEVTRIILDLGFMVRIENESVTIIWRQN